MRLLRVRPHFAFGALVEESLLAIVDASMKSESAVGSCRHILCVCRVLCRTSVVVEEGFAARAFPSLPHLSQAKRLGSDFRVSDNDNSNTEHLSRVLSGTSRLLASALSIESVVEAQ